MKKSITLTGIVCCMILFGLTATNSVFASNRIGIFSDDIHHVHSYKRSQHGNRHGRSYKRRFNYGKHHSYGYKHKPYRRKYRYDSYDSHYGRSYKKHRRKHKRRYYGKRHGYGSGYKGYFSYGFYYGRPYSNLGGYYYNKRKSCHPVSKYTYDDYGNRHKIGGTMCYDQYGQGYVVEGSRYKIW